MEIDSVEDVTIRPEICINAIIWLALQERETDSILSDVMVAYGNSARRIEEMDTIQILELIKKASEVLGRRGVLPEKLTRPYRLRITRDYRILLTDYGDMELKLMPMPKMLFILFLKHPEGIRFAELSTYRDEMMGIYERISPRLDKDAMAESIRNIAEMRKNSFHSQKTRLSKSLAEYFEVPALNEYQISCDMSTGRTNVRLSRTMVSWD